MAIRQRHSGHGRPGKNSFRTHAAHLMHDERTWLFVAIGLLILLLAIVIGFGTQYAGARPPTVRPYAPYLF